MPRKTVLVLAMLVGAGLTTSKVVCQEKVPVKEKRGGGMADCTLWRYESEGGEATGYYLKTGDEWVEMAGDKLYARFQETKRTAAYVELYDGKRSMSLRLRADQILWKQPRTDWNVLPVDGHGSRELVVKSGDDARGMADCTLWRAEPEKGGESYFLKQGGEWVEVAANNTLVARFKETKRTAEYVEVYDGKREMSLRLYPDRILWKQPRTEWSRLPIKGRALQESAIKPGFDFLAELGPPVEKAPSPPTVPVIIDP